MIPAFPNFKEIDIDDKESIEYYTNQFLPYSDFNFTNLWSWNPKANSGRMISELNGNLAVLFTDYRTNKPSLSFIGKNECAITARTLIEYANENGISTTLRYISQEAAESIAGYDLMVEEDIENFDYIFSVPQIAESYGLKFKSKRHLAKRFLRDNPNAEFQIMDFSDKKYHEQIISVIRKWEDGKIKGDKYYELQHEETALIRLLETAPKHNLILSGVFLDSKLVGFSIDELLPGQYAISHFLKADFTLKGVYEFLNVEVAKYLHSKNVNLWNWEQDLNIEGLRKLKMSYRPIDFLKKFTIRKKEKSINTLIKTIFRFLINK